MQDLVLDNISDIQSVQQFLQIFGGRMQQYQENNVKYSLSPCILLPKEQLNPQKSRIVLLIFRENIQTKTLGYADLTQDTANFEKKTNFFDTLNAIMPQFTNGKCQYFNLKSILGVHIYQDQQQTLFIYLSPSDQLTIKLSFCTSQMTQKWKQLLEEALSPSYSVSNFELIQVNDSEEKNLFLKQSLQQKEQQLILTKKMLQQKLNQSEKLEKELQIVQQQLNESNKKIKRLQILQNQNQQLQKFNQNMLEDVNNLTTENNTLKHELRDLDLRWKKISVEIKKQILKNTELKNSMVSYQNNFSAKNYQVIELTRQNTELKQQLNEQAQKHQKIIEKKQKKINTLTASIQSKDSTNAELSQKIQSVQSENQNLTKKVMQLNESLEIQKSKNLKQQQLKISSDKEKHQLRDQLSQKMKQNINLLDKIQTISQQKNNMEILLKQTQNKYQKISKLITKMQQQNKQTQIEIEKLKTKEKELNYSLRQARNEARSHIADKENLKKQLSTNQKNIEKLTTMKESSQNQCKDFKKQLDKLNNQFKEKVNQILQMSKLNQQFKAQTQQANKAIQDLNTMKQGQQSTIAQLEKKNGLLQQLHSIQCNKYKKIIEQQEQNIKVLENASYFHIFQGKTLNSCLSQKKFLKKQIQFYNNKQIAYTKMLYAYDPLNQTNYHKYIDQHKNICVVLRLKNGRLLSAYSVSPVSSDTIATEGGLVFSLTERKVFRLIEGRRSVTYDNYFLIFGNSQFRIKHNDIKFFSNFGIANSYFDSNGEKHSVLTGGDARELELDYYEIFQVMFNN